MRIPVGDFGYHVPRRAQPDPRAFVSRGVDDLAEGVGALGVAGAQINIANEREAAVDASGQLQEAKAEARQRAAEERQLAREAKRAEAMTIHARTQNDLATESDRIRLGISDGTIRKEDAPGMWANTSQKIVEGRLAEVEQASVPLVRGALENDLGSHGRQINAAIVQRNRHDIGANLNAALEEHQRFAVSDPRAAIKQAHLALDGMGPQAGLNPEQIGKAKQAFTEQATFLVARKFVIDNQNNAGQLQAFLKALPSNKELDPQRAMILEGQALGYITRLENQAQAAENRRTARAQVALTRVSTLIDNGLTPDPNEVNAAIQMAKGTPFEAEANGIVRDQRFMADMLKLPPQKQVEFVNEARAKYTKDGASREDWNSLARMERTVKRTVEQVQTQPLAYAQNRTGAEIERLDLTKPDSWGDNLRNRSTVLLGQRQQLGGQSSLAGLFPEEVAALKSVLRSAPPAVQADTLAKLRQGFSDAAVFRATMAQLAPDDPVTAKAGIFAANDRQSQAGKSVATEILAGQQILNPNRKEDGKPGKGFPMPKDADLESEWANHTGSAYAGYSNLRSVDYQAAKALYAARADAEGDQSGELNNRRWRAAINLVTGGIASHKGREVILPYGMSYGDFKDGLKARVEPLQERLDPSMRIDSLLALPLEPAGADGKYAFRAGDALVTDRDGQPIIVDFNAPPPAKVRQ